MENKERLLSPEDVAKQRNIATATGREDVREGRIKGMKVGKLWRVRESDLQRHIEKDRI